MAGILDVAAAIRTIGAAAVASAKEVAQAEVAIYQMQQTATSTSGSVTGGTSGAVGGSIGASNSNSPVTSRGMSAAISAARRSA